MSVDWSEPFALVADLTLSGFSLNSVVNQRSCGPAGVGAGQRISGSRRPLVGKGPSRRSPACCRRLRLQVDRLPVGIVADVGSGDYLRFVGGAHPVLPGAPWCWFPGDNGTLFGTVGNNALTHGIASILESWYAVERGGDVQV